MKPPTFTIISPESAALLFGVTPAWIRRLAVAGEIPSVVLRTSGRKACAAYSFDACVERWGAPDPDRIALMVHVPLMQTTGAGAAIFNLIMPRPMLETADGDLAISMESNK